MGSRIVRIEYYLPETILTNEELEACNPNWKASKIEKKIGIKQRHIANYDETSLDLAVKAAELLFQHVDKNLIDFLLFCTQSPDHILPTSACIIQDKLKLRRDIGALDFNLGCSGYVYGLALAKSLINSGTAQNVLLLTGETYTKFIADEDVANRSIFGDAATASLITYSSDEKIGNFIFGTNGGGAQNLRVDSSDARANYLQMDLTPTLYMNGPEIFNFTIETIPPLVEDILSKNMMQTSDIDYVILHQANKYILEFLISHIGLDQNKCHVDMVNYGNTVSNTIPIALRDSLDRGVISSGSKALLVGFGVGYSWGGVVVEL